MGVERSKSGAGAEHTHTAIYKIGNQQGPSVQYRDLHSVFCDNLYEKRILKKKIYIYIYIYIN